MTPPDPAVAKLLRWYPRAWRERYGDEFMAMVEDSLDGRRPTWRLRAGVAWSGLRLPAEDLPDLVRRIVHLSATRPRHELLWDLSALGPVLENAGHDALVEAVARSVMQVADQWP